MLGELEQIVLLAVLRVGEDAYGVPVHDEIVRLAERDLTLGTVYKTLSRLEEKGLAQRMPVEGRVRAQAMVLTAAGRALVPKLAALADANDHHFFGHLPAHERQELVEAMQALVRHHQLKEIPTG